MRKITSEYVSDGHPDKMADQVSDLVLDAILREQPESKVAIETLIKNSTVIVAGEVTTPKKDFFNKRFKRILNKEIRHLINDLGFPDDHELKPADVEILYLVGEQSVEINSAVVGNDGAGDQGFMVGYASNDSPDYLPLGLYISKKIIQYVRGNLNNDYGPDMKSQVTVDEFKNIDTIVLSTMMKNNNDFTQNQKILEDIIRNNYMNLPQDIADKITSETNIIINPAGDWKIGGPVSDCGVTGRKIVVDQYGCYSHVGGGAFCFDGDTLVKTDSGYKKIKEISVGDIVWTLNETTNELELKPVRELYRKSAEESYDLLELELENGEIIKITENHEVLTDRGWVMAKDLTVDDNIKEYKSYNVFSVTF